MSETTQDYQRFGLARSGRITPGTIGGYAEALAWKPYYETVFGETFDTPERVAEMERRAVEMKQAWINEQGLLLVAGIIGDPRCHGRQWVRVEDGLNVYHFEAI